MLTFDDEQRVHGTLVRWVRAPRHLNDGCSCEGASDLLLVSSDGALWLPVALADPGEHDAEVLDDLGDCPQSVALVVAAFGLPWPELTFAVTHGQLVLMAALEEETLGVLAGLEVGRVLEMRRTCPDPAGVVRSLRLMREYGARTQ